MGDLSQSTLAFLDAMKLPEGFKEEYSFATPKEADSFRVSLYAIKRKLQDDSVLISISGKSITLTKKTNSLERKRISPTGEITEISKESEASSYQKQVEEIILDSKDFPEHQQAEFIRDAIAKITSSSTTARRAN